MKREDLHLIIREEEVSFADWLKDIKGIDAEDFTSELYSKMIIDDINSEYSTFRDMRDTYQDWVRFGGMLVFCDDACIFATDDAGTMSDMYKDRLDEYKGMSLDDYIKIQCRHALEELGMDDSQIEKELDW